MSAKQPIPLSFEHVEILSSLFEDYRKDVVRFLGLKTLNGDLAEDLTSQVFENAASALKNGTYNSQGRDKSWILRIAHNVFIDHTRKSKKLPTLRALPGMDNDPLDGVPEKTLSYLALRMNAELSQEVKDLVYQLPSEQREVVILRMYGKLPFKEIAIFQGVSINTSLGRMRYALINLRKFIKEQNLDLSGYSEPG